VALEVLHHPQLVVQTLEQAVAVVVVHLIMMEVQVVVQV
jgi:hypothetical protein